jgi:DNA-3-methyladenine glycosylase I
MEKRCPWAGDDPLMIAYHDTEWGIPVHDDRLFFEFLILEGAQAGLSWQTVLRKRENYRKALHNFNPVKIASYNQSDLHRLLSNPGLIRNRLKLSYAILNARCFLKVQEEFGTFEAYIWRFVKGRPLIHRLTTMSQLPARSAESDEMSRDLLRRGFKFVGSTICYAFMQATGMVNDHLVSCPRWKEPPSVRS